VAALHNHFFWDSPKVMFMHIGGMGSEEQLAAAVGKMFAKIKETSAGHGEVPKADVDPAKTSLDPRKIEAIVGEKGDLKDGVYKLVIGRTTRMDGSDVGNAMGVNTWAAFAGSNEKAIVDGDFAMLETEMQDVLKALRAAHINVVAIHQHMAGEKPRVMFLHFWGVGASGRRKSWREACAPRSTRPRTKGRTPSERSCSGADERRAHPPPQLGVDPAR
jgi:hypothetical protein